MKYIYEKTALVVISCDNYSDLWAGYEKSINKFWPDCLFDIYLITNYKEFESNRLKTIQVGEDFSWSRGLKEALKVIKEKYKYSIITLEDLFLIDYVDNNYLISTLKKALDQDVKYLRLHRNKYKKSKTTELYEPIKNNVLYRLNCTYSLWNNAFLFSLLKEEESAWQFEYNVPERVKEEDKIFMVKEPIFKYSNTVIKGKWVPSEVNTIKKIFPDFIITRDVMNQKESDIIKRNEKRNSIALNYLPKSLLRNLVLAKRKYLNKK